MCDISDQLLHYSTFFRWTKSERFVIYMAICDGLFNIAHFSDHLHILIAKKLPTPKSLCVFYGFLLGEFITAQNLMVNLVAINVFVLIFFHKKINFGRWDHRLLLYIFGAPGFALTIVGALGQLGPNGSLYVTLLTVINSNIVILNSICFLLSILT